MKLFTLKKSVIEKKRIFYKRQVKAEIIFLDKCSECTYIKEKKTFINLWI